jgi:hypothetical protein
MSWSAGRILLLDVLAQGRWVHQQVGVPGLAVELAQLGAMSAHASRVISSARSRCRAVNT